MNNIPERIKLARRIRRFSMDELVQQMREHAVSKMAISKIERGLMQPSPSTLQAIADACHLPLSFFNQPMLDLGELEFRFSQSVTEEQRQQVMSLASKQLQNYFGVQSFLGEPLPFTHPIRDNVLRNYADVEAAVLKLRRKWEIGLQPIHSVYELLVCYGIHVLEIDLGCDNILGLSTFVNKGTPIIIINTRTHTTTERKRFTALHEVCHLLFRLRPDDEVHHQAYLAALPSLPYTVTLKRPTEERLCDLFASAMLMPEPCVRRRFGQMRTNVSIDELIATRCLYGNSVAAQIHRLHDLRIIDDNLYTYFYEVPIKQNRMEEGWGQYPIMETADRMPMLEERMRTELERMEVEHTETCMQSTS